MDSKKCTNCGNDNDPILTNCLFCKSPLPVIDMNSISNEALVMNAGEWIGKLKGGYYIRKDKDSNFLTQKGIKFFNKTEIQGYARQYLSLIQVRALSNPPLFSLYEDLKKEYEQGSAADDIYKRVGKTVGKGCLWYFIFAIIMMIISLIGMVIFKNR